MESARHWRYEEDRRLLELRPDVLGLADQGAQLLLWKVSRTAPSLRGISKTQAP